MMLKLPMKFLLALNHNVLVYICDVFLEHTETLHLLIQIARRCVTVGKTITLNVCMPVCVCLCVCLYMCMTWRGEGVDMCELVYDLKSPYANIVI